jgi:hypothetical protein
VTTYRLGTVRRGASHAVHRPRRGIVVAAWTPASSSWSARRCSPQACSHRSWPCACGCPASCSSSASACCSAPTGWGGCPSTTTRWRRRSASSRSR